MPISPSTEMRTRLARYLSGEASLREFDEWFVPATWDVEKTRDQAAIDLAYEIILRLAEYSDGDCTEVQLKDLLRPLAAAPTVSAATA
jgi:site-specific recombinase XerC